MKISNFIGNTPIVKISNPHGSNFANIFVKLEENLMPVEALNLV